MSHFEAPLCEGQVYPITYHGFSTHVRRGLDKAGVADFRIHDLRHTSATRTLRATKNLKIVQKLLNHSFAQRDGKVRPRGS